MAKVNDNIITEGLTGRLGKQIVFRKGRNGTTIVSRRPSFSDDRAFNPDQLEHQKAFRKAIAYAKGAKGHPAYARKAEGTEATPFNIAVADWFQEPEVLDINRNGWSGLAGQTILITAMDNVLVSEVEVVVRSADNSVIEQGQAVQSESDSTVWVYTMQTSMPAEPSPVLTATARDMPGNTNSMYLEL